jgi:hypothetical protein
MRAPSPRSFAAAIAGLFAENRGRGRRIDGNRQQKSAVDFSQLRSI